MHYKEIIKTLESLKNPKNVAGMARFGIRPKTKVYGISMPKVREIGKKVRKSVGGPSSHKLALKLWDTKIHEARILAGLLAEPEKLTEAQINKWVKGFDSWDVVDQVCMNLFDKSELAVKKIPEFAKREKEFEKRTAFALMAALAVHNKDMLDKDFMKFFALIKKASTDERNFVKKAVNWALRQIGKRNKKLNKEAIKLAIQLRSKKTKPEKWIGGDAYRELTSRSVQKKLV